MLEVCKHKMSKQKSLKICKNLAMRDNLQKQLVILCKGTVLSPGMCNMFLLKYITKGTYFHTF